MRFHHLALSALTFLAVNSISGNYNGIAYANEDDTTNEESIAPETTSTAYTPPETSESFTYQAEVNRMLDIVVNSLYQKKDVFLRELISNASDALDKIRFLSIEEPSLLDDKEEMEIKIQFDEAEKSITITDSGIGMTKADLISNLGTVARSGTTNFVEAIKKGSADVNMIGQFGVGFYSSFLVADRVRVASKHHDDPVQHVWESVNGQSDFHIYADPRGDSLGRGTEITLFLKEDAMEYCSGEKIKELVEFYSEFINHPIKIRTVSTMEVPVDEEEDEDEEKGGGDDEEEDDEEDEDEDDDDDDEDEKKEDEDKDDLEVGDDETPAKEKKMETVTTYSWDQVNTNRPIWNRSKDDITDDEYNQFYKVISKDNDDPAKWTHFDAEGNINFKSIMYLPGKLPYQLKYSNWNPDEKIGGLKLYVRKVLISDEFELLPPYFSKFVKGVVDSEDLPLNVNREALQESKIVKVIQKKLVRKVIEMIRKLSEEKPEDDEEEEDLKLDDDDEGEDEEKEKEDKEKEVKESPYIKWYKEFFTGLKMGVLEDDTNRMKLFKLLRFKTTKYPGDDDWVSVDDYVSRMHDWQTEIYYAAGESIDDIKDSDFMEVFKKKDVEVLYFTDPIDEYMTNRLTQYDGKKLTAITKTGLKFGDEDSAMVKRREKIYSDKFKPLVKFLKKTFDSEITRVQISKRLESAPVVVSPGENGHTANMERVLAAQALKHGADDHTAFVQRVLEINPRHPFCSKMLEMVTPPEESEDDDFEPTQEAKDLAWMLYDMATMSSGYDITNSTNYGARMLRVLQSKLEIETMELEDEIDPPVEEDVPPEPEESEGMNAEDFDFDAEEPEDLDV